MTESDQLAGRLRDLALVELDSLGAALIGAYADDVADALRAARAEIAVLRRTLAADPLAVVDLAPAQRASDAAQAGAARTRDRLVEQAGAARALSRLAELAAALAPKLFEADRRRSS